MSLILGIDPGLQKMGWGLVLKEGTRLRYVASGLVCPPVKQSLDMRLRYLHDGVVDVVQRYQPDVAAIEETFMTANGASTLKLGQARGAIILALSLQGLPVHEYAALLVKKTVVGVGRAEKDQVGMMVRHLLPGCSVSQPDEADALAIAICHSSHSLVHRLNRDIRC